MKPSCWEEAWANWRGKIADRHRPEIGNRKPAIPIGETVVAAPGGLKADPTERFQVSHHLENVDYRVGTTGLAGQAQPDQIHAGDGRTGRTTSETVQDRRKIGGHFYRDTCYPGLASD